MKSTHADEWYLVEKYFGNCLLCRSIVVESTNRGMIFPLMRKHMREVHSG